MKWVTNRIGKEQIWYSADVIKKIEEIALKTCDCYSFGDTCLSNNADRLYCKDITDCLLKQIVIKCQSCIDKGFVMSRYGCKVPVSEGWDLASEILELLEIEEIDEM